MALAAGGLRMESTTTHCKALGHETVLLPEDRLDATPEMRLAVWYAFDVSASLGLQSATRATKSFKSVLSLVGSGGYLGRRGERESVEEWQWWQSWES